MLGKTKKLSAQIVKGIKAPLRAVTPFNLKIKFNKIDHGIPVKENVDLNRKKVILLVPGALNSIVPGGFTSKKGIIPYFGADIVKSLSDKYEVHVVNDLLPTGSFDENGEIVYQYIRKLSHSREEHIELMVIGHSSGGLYTLAALHNKENLGFLSKVLFLSTPLKGAVLADVFTTRTSDFFVRTLKFVNLFPGIDQLRRSEIRSFVEGIRVPEKISFYAATGHLCDRAKSPLVKADFISRVMHHTNEIIKRKTGATSDGIVEIISALPRNLKFTSQNDEKIPLNILESPKAELNHWYMFWNKQLIFLPKRKSIMKEREKFYHELVENCEF